MIGRLFAQGVGARDQFSDRHQLAGSSAHRQLQQPVEIADRLFESFVTSGKKNGTGLGLALVKTIVEEHEGTVSFKSKPGKGTTFEIRMPAGTPLDQ